MLTPDAQLITALGGTEDVDPDEHIRGFKHTHTGESLLVLQQATPCLARGKEGGRGGCHSKAEESLCFDFICNTCEKGKGHRVVMCNWVQHLQDAASTAWLAISRNRLSSFCLQLNLTTASLNTFNVCLHAKFAWAPSLLLL